MNRIQLLYVLLLVSGLVFSSNAAAQGRVIEGTGYWVLDQLKMTTEDQPELLRLLGELPQQEEYRITIQTADYISTYGEMSMDDIQLINEQLSAAEGDSTEGFTLFHDCLYQHNGECTLVHEYIYTVGNRAEDPVSAQIDALLSQYQ
ncbi:MAG: hypothetical protein KDC44_05630 [Phaeodactylibacter sp.]|nr:hypothetical protein [Phaeodactylibacter sp.]